MGVMPKERIQSRNTPTLDVTVGWSRDGGVQVATVAADADRRLRGWAETPTAQPVGITVSGADLVSQPGTSFTRFDGWHVDLDRDQVNTLIRVLRRARDQAFGRDE